MAGVVPQVRPELMSTAGELLISMAENALGARLMVAMSLLRRLSVKVSRGSQQQQPTVSGRADCWSSSSGGAGSHR